MRLTPEQFGLVTSSRPHVLTHREHRQHVKHLCLRRSYGCVFKANYKETGEIVAIKQVPVESDLQEIIKEISIMQQCNRYYCE